MPRQLAGASQASQKEDEVYKTMGQLSQLIISKPPLDKPIAPPRSTCPPRELVNYQALPSPQVKPIEYDWRTKRALEETKRGRDSFEMPAKHERAPSPDPVGSMRTQKEKEALRKKQQKHEHPPKQPSNKTEYYPKLVPVPKQDRPHTKNRKSQPARRHVEMSFASKRLSDSAFATTNKPAPKQTCQLPSKTTDTSAKTKLTIVPQSVTTFVPLVLPKIPSVLPKKIIDRGSAWFWDETLPGDLKAADLAKIKCISHVNRCVLLACRQVAPTVIDKRRGQLNSRIMSKLHSFIKRLPEDSEFDLGFGMCIYKSDVVNKRECVCLLNMKQAYADLLSVQDLSLSEELLEASAPEFVKCLAGSSAIPATPNCEQAISLTRWAIGDILLPFSGRLLHSLKEAYLQDANQLILITSYYIERVAQKFMFETYGPEPKTMQQSVADVINNLDMALQNDLAKAKEGALDSKQIDGLGQFYCALISSFRILRSRLTALIQTPECFYSLGGLNRNYWAPLDQACAERELTPTGVLAMFQAVAAKQASAEAQTTTSTLSSANAADEEKPAPESASHPSP